MHRPGADPEAILPSDILCDFCTRPWSDDIPLVEGHQGSCICGKCLATAWQAVIDAGVLTQVVRLLEHKAPSVVTPALRILGNLVTGDDIQTQQVLDASPDEVWKAVHFL